MHQTSWEKSNIFKVKQTSWEKNQTSWEKSNILNILKVKKCLEGQKMFNQTSWEKIKHLQGQTNVLRKIKHLEKKSNVLRKIKRLQGQTNILRNIKRLEGQRSRLKVKGQGYDLENDLEWSFQGYIGSSYYTTEVTWTPLPKN